MNRCPTGKQSYPSPNAVWNVINYLSSKSALRTHKQTGKPGGHAYPCPHCGNWHMTQAIPNRRRESIKAKHRDRIYWQEEGQP